MPSLTRDEAQARASLIDVESMEVDLDLTTSSTTFESDTQIVFRAAAAEPTFVDLKAVDVHEVELNDVALDPATVVDGRLPITPVEGRNTLRVRATMPFSNDGQGLHRSVDPEDHREYVYGHLFLDAAPKVFACFDQPDLKAPYTVTVRAPEEWIVTGNGDPLHEGGGQWRLATTKPLSTYFVTVCAGPYVQQRDTWRGPDGQVVPLVLHARASLAEELAAQAPQMFEVTRQCMSYFHELFGIDYPFGEYHQIFVPEFNAGAMENPGCVTFRDQFVFQGAITRQGLLSRTNTIAHEMAHMWFGDLVTPVWWDDLWLNESFAEYMAHRACVAATEFTEAWVDFGVGRKPWGYAAERSPSTHPVAGAPAHDGDTALQNFDGISYAKGASALRQLIEWMGDEHFISGVRDHLTTHAYGNATLADFLGSMESASGRDVQGWAAAWLETAGLDRISVELTTRQDADGVPVIETATLVRDQPQGAAGAPANRPHALTIAGWTDGDRAWEVELELDADRVEVPELAGRPVPRLVVPNAADTTWATAVLDAESLAALPAQLPQVDEPVTRAMLWAALFDAVAEGETDPRELVATFTRAFPVESDASILATAGAYTARFVRTMVPAAEREGLLEALAAAGRERTATAEPGTTTAWLGARVVAGCSSDAEELRRWARGQDLPEGLEADDDFRWQAVKRLAQLGALDGELELMAQHDTSLSGQLSALMARASQPDAESKAWAWAELAGRESGRSNYERNNLAQGFWSSGEPEALAGYVERYLTEVPALSGVVGEDALARVAQLAFPLPVPTQATADAVDAVLAGGTVSPAVRRSMVDQRAVLTEVLRSQERYGA
ncbi:aminopeptidase N [Kytococcus sedentarius]|uniref:aminopeptidase N n=1 Tax=Kytococcus sedentarius TaxID=1276 RepID=UPI00194E6BE1|nr:aminopeptidase N [Kytococcus sedentarius]QRO86908.1 aminopeptidase N [Kytococcus sedentarius]